LGRILSDFLIALSAVFFVVDPVAVVPIFLAMTRRDSPEKARRMASRACLVAAGLLTFFALFGTVLFQVFGITLSSFRVAGGVLLLVTSLDMLRATPAATRTSPAETAEGVAKDDIALVPLAMPLLAGPGAMATVVVLMARDQSPVTTTISVLVSIALTFIASYVILRGATVVQRFLGQGGLAMLERVMGLLLAAIAIQFIAAGGRELLSKAL